MSKLFIFIQLFILFSLFQVQVFAVKKSYIVYLGTHSHNSEVTGADLHSVTLSHHNFLTSFLGSKKKARSSIITSFKRHINGFAAFLDEEEAAEIAKHPKVVSVFLNKGRELHTTHSWEFLLLEKGRSVHPKSLWKKANFGKDVIIANIDSGVWPESKSFSDEGFGPVPSRWKGSCQPGAGVPCNRKLIGAKYFNKGYLADTGFKVNSTFETARDLEGHGSHTLSTAGGNFVHGASIFGVGNLTVKGGSPKARVASYKVCWPSVKDGGCFDSDILEAMDMAIHDGVDVVSISVGGEPLDYFEDSISIASFHAVKHGIVVICSAGNNGSYPSTVSNVSPWIITVGASTLDREFEAFVQLHNGSSFKGMSLSHPLPKDTFYQLITGGQARKPNATVENAMLCKAGTLDSEKVSGKILVCLRGETDRLDKGQQAVLAGAAGMIFCNSKNEGDELVADPHLLPASHLTYTDCLSVFEYINSTDHPLGFITPPTQKVGKQPAPVMADFSSRGPNPITPHILKPDITAPGVGIIAAFSERANPTDVSFDTRKVPFNALSGTSMSCPHVSGVVGLLKALHPHWSAAAIHSAIMTTARTRDNRKKVMLNSSLVEKATPFAYGSGHIQPNRAMDPGLVYDRTMNDYLHFLCGVGYSKMEMISFSFNYECPKSGTSLLDFNYPSISVPNITHSATVTRRLKNVGSPGTYTARLIEPRGFWVSVKPNSLKFEKLGEEKSFKLTLKPKRPYNKLKSGEYVFGGLNWSDGKHYVRTPIVVSRLDQDSE